MPLLKTRRTKIRCYCCNRNLSDYESTLRSATTGDFLDTCNKCLKDLDIRVLESNKEVDTSTPDDEEFIEVDDEVS